MDAFTLDNRSSSADYWFGHFRGGPYSFAGIRASDCTPTDQGASEAAPIRVYAACSECPGRISIATEQAQRRCPASKLIHYVDPRYTRAARRKRLSGICVLSVVVEINGKPQDIHVTQSMADSVAPKYRALALGLDRQAVKAVEKWRFYPGTFEGKPVPIEIKVQISFKIIQ